MNVQATARPIGSLGTTPCAMVTCPLTPIDSNVASDSTPASAGRLNSSRSTMSALPAVKIINVVTSPVIRATPPELTANTISTTNRICTAASRRNASTVATLTRVAVTLSQIDDSTKANPAMMNIRCRQPACRGSHL